ncbi:MAG: type II toxin-antitoxin system HicA family toxin [Oscillospiraceae bacterium]|nr:type II toxin-antitoxin system HicA family toxin [Oscillospiraceae bacterium]
MKYSELKRLLKKNGCSFLCEGNRHEIWYSPKTDAEFPVGRHNSQEVMPGTLKAILKQAGIK